LKEQKLKKDLEYEEAHKLKNLIRGLDDDEVHFLDLIDQHKFETEKKQQLEVEKELDDYRKKVAAFQEEATQKKLENTNCKRASKLNLKTKSTQKSLLSGIIKKTPAITDKDGSENSVITNTAQKRKSEENAKENTCSTSGILDRGALKCVAILPGIGRYKESSDSEMSSDSEEEISNDIYDLCGRKKIKKCEQDQE